MISEVKHVRIEPRSAFQLHYTGPLISKHTRDASEQVRAEDPVRMRTSNILALPTLTSDTAITPEFSKNYLPKILDPNSEYRSLLRDHSQPLKVKLRNRPRVFYWKTAISHWTGVYSPSAYHYSAWRKTLL